MKTLLITASNTESGKTVLTTALAAYWQKYRSDSSLGIMKPIQSGEGDAPEGATGGDREWYQKLFSLNQSSEEITPLYYKAPLAPPVAAAKENQIVDLAVVWQTFTTLQNRFDFLLVEALGGMGSPVTDEMTVADLAGAWQIPTVLVVPVKLGAIAEAVANVALARQSRVKLVGIVLNCVQPRSDTEIADWTPIDLIQRLTNTPVLGCLPYLENPADLDKLVKVASDLELEHLI